MTTLLYGLSFLLDLMLGDPPHWPHPIRWIGQLICLLQNWLRRHCHSERALYGAGALLWVATVGITYLVTWGLIALLTAIHPWLGLAATVWLTYTILAARCLRDAAMAVYRALQSGSIEESRRQLSYIVGRDTASLDSTQVGRAVVETVAENTVDGVIAPLFWLFIGGAPLAMAYKAVNTLDSMVGYRNEKYRAIGCVSARMDDLANLIPARLGWLLLSLAAALLGLRGRSALCLGWRDRYQHKSPNSGWSEATVAGALGVRLGGPSYYFGALVEKPWLGEEERPLAPADILTTVRLMYLSSMLAFCLFAVAAFVFKEFVV
ncbi:adenosylcobinamide-phosphate synthase CbiB [Aeromonas sp. MdU4]|uniref:adenosylcobinamide-phosphate synthase CbiB n=1 Tax=Aeromonas sp. MdU4 TaxID=3342819 RepID=UPI0035B974F9